MQCFTLLRGVDFECGVIFVAEGYIRSAGMRPGYRVEKTNPENFSCLLQARGHVVVLAARTWIARRMVVKNDQSDRPSENGGLKNFSWVHERCSGGADRNNRMSDGLVAGVEVERNEVLSCFVMDDPPRKSNRLHCLSDG